MGSFLSERKRQPKIYIDLPSQGIFYDENIIQDKQFTEIPVFGMNTMDEIKLKTPDALFSGQSTVDVIRSCIPVIKDPWQLVGYDIDFILIAIRISTYGELMAVTSTCPQCGSSLDSDLNLNSMLSDLSDKNIFYSVPFDDLRLDLKPLNYKKQTEFSKKQYILERQLLHINDSDKNEDEKNQLKQEVYTDISKLTAEMVINYIFNIKNDKNEREFDFKAIKDFIVNNDAVIFQDLQLQVKKMNTDWQLPDIEINCNNQTCQKSYKTSINMDYSNFFGDKSLRSRILK